MYIRNNRGMKHMKKLLPMLVVGFLVLGGLQAVALFEDRDEGAEKTEHIFFSDPITHEEGEYLVIDVENVNSWVKQPHKPMLPAYIKTFEFPFGTKIKDVIVTFPEIKTRVLSKKVTPASEPVPLISEIDTIEETEIDEMVYSSSDLYPDCWYSYSVGCGLNRKEHVTILTVRCFPVRYSPLEDTIYYANNVDIMVTYKEPKTIPFPATTTYDLVVIAPSVFADDLKPLVTHKEVKGVKTLLKTTEDIYSGYPGVDKPEQIKYFIKEAIESWNITYVLLVGGMKSMFFGKPKDDRNQGSKSWYVPVRYTNLRDSGKLYDPGYVSDLYYADIYDGDGNFSSWDSDDDGIFAKWDMSPGRDIIDLYPDVYVGRLACRNRLEVKLQVYRITTYESSLCPSSWFNTMVLIGGDTFNDVDSTNYYEGEVENQKALDYMTGFNPVKIWCSNRDTGGLVPVPKDIIKTVSSGCGFLFFAGHGSPERWNTYWCEAFGEERAKGLWYYHMPFFYNWKKLPVCVVGGCHNSQFNITAFGTLLDRDNSKHTWCYGSFIPKCWSWWLTSKIGGGAIATIGNTGLGYGKPGETGDLDGDNITEPDCIEALGGFIETEFFKAYGVDDVEILGETWGQAVATYLKVFPGMDYILDCKTVQQWALLGDPSLRIGGYE